jgi:transposase, IS5 family
MITVGTHNEGTRLKDCVEKYKSRFGYYPLEVLVDKIYCTRVNRAYLKELGITLKAKPLGRPSKQALSNQVSPGERNPIEGKFGQAKTAYGLDRIKARLANTSESWVASIILVLNLVNLAELVQYCLKIILSKYLIIQQNIFFTEKYSNLSQIRV